MRGPCGRRSWTKVFKVGKEGRSITIPVWRLAPDGLLAWAQVVERGYEGLGRGQRVRSRRTGRSRRTAGGGRISAGAAAQAEGTMNDTDARLCHPGLRINRVLRVVNLLAAATVRRRPPIEADAGIHGVK